MRLELDSGSPPNKIDTIFAYYEVGFFETTQFLPELSGNFKSRDHEFNFPALIISCTFFSTPFLLPALGKDDWGNQNFLYETSENNVQKSVRIVGMSDLFRL